MTRRTYWGIAALIVILIAAGGFMYWQWSQVQQLKEQLAQDEKMLEDKDKQVAENDLPPARPGFKWVPHDDHYHQVPIDAPDVWQAPHETHELEEIVFDTPMLKSDLPDELPEKFPTDAELQKMSAIDIIHLIRLYEEKTRSLRKTDYDASVKLHNTIMPKLWARSAALREESNAHMEEFNRRSMERAGFYPATEEVPAKIITVIPPEDYETEKTEGGNK